MAGLVERFKRWLGDPEPIRNSSLAERVTEEVRVRLDILAKEARQKEEEEGRKIGQARREAEEDNKKSERIKRELQETFSKLGVMETLQDLQKNVWRGGEIYGPVVEAKANKGAIASQIAFSYPTATEGYWAPSTESTYQGAVISGSPGGFEPPRIFMDTESLTIGFQLETSTKILKRRRLLLDVNQDFKDSIYWRFQIDPDPIADEAIPLEFGSQAMSRLKDFIIKDSASRVLEGKLPLTDLVEAGQQKIKAVIENSKVKGYRVVDTR